MIFNSQQIIKLVNLVAFKKLNTKKNNMKTNHQNNQLLHQSFEYVEYYYYYFEMNQIYQGCIIHCGGLIVHPKMELLVYKSKQFHCFVVC